MGKLTIQHFEKLPFWFSNKYILVPLCNDYWGANQSDDEGIGLLNLAQRFALTYGLIDDAHVNIHLSIRGSALQ